MVTDEEVAVLEQFRHTPFAGRNQLSLALPLFPGPATGLFGELRGYLLTEGHQPMQDRLDDLLEDVEFADLMASLGP
jgi:hypothetical protein